MQWLSNLRRIGATGRTAGAAVFVGLILLLGACGAFPELHSLVCANANQPGDHCAITKFIGGAVEAPLVAAAVAVLFFCLTILPCWNVSVCRVAPPFRLAPSRAPPSGSLLG